MRKTERLLGNGDLYSPNQAIVSIADESEGAALGASTLSAAFFDRGERLERGLAHAQAGVALARSPEIGQVLPISEEPDRSQRVQDRLLLLLVGEGAGPAGLVGAPDGIEVRSIEHAQQQRQAAGIVLAGEGQRRV